MAESNVGRQNCGNISRFDFIDCKKLIVRYGDDDSTWQVTEYKISFQKEGNEIQDFDVKGEMIPSKMDTIMLLSPPGTKIYFEYIKGAKKNDPHDVFYLAPLTFVLTE